MDELARLIHTHLALYPGMGIVDCVKLIYQNELGGAHLLQASGGCDDGEETLLRGLEEELLLPELRSPDPALPDVVPIGAGLCRVSLAALAAGPSTGTFARLCACTAGLRKGSKEGLRCKLERFSAMVAAGRTPYSMAEWERFLAENDLQSGAPPHHSARFRALYRPHYHILDAAEALYLPVYAAIDRALAQKPHVLVGIDGMAGAGKSSLGAALAKVYGCGVVHADDFFLRPAQRSAERLAEAGGNIDYERLAPVAHQAADDRAFCYQAYDCVTGAMGVWRELPAARLTVLEGSYALHPKVDAPCDVRVFLGCDAQVQARRVAARSGPALWPRFEREWIPMENRYFAAFGVRESCDVILDTSGLGG